MTILKKHGNSNHSIEAMKTLLSEEDEFFLKQIYEPKVVTIPPCDACRNMCVTVDGEIRIYGAINKKSFDDVGDLVYISSADCGLSWKSHLMPKDALGSAGCNLQTGRYISCYPNEYRPDLNNSFGKKGTWAILNDEGYDGKNNRFIKLSDKLVHILRLPMYFESAKRWFILGEYRYPDMKKCVILFYSDDDGESWTENIIEDTAPKFEIKPPHKGARWQEYSCEPTIAELSNHELIMIVRTSQDYHYIYHSYDFGETWTKPQPSIFHGTITMPVLQKLSDGRILFFWCNNQPMPEIDKKEVFPKLSDEEINGTWEDVFTNRDANHIAISEDDGQTWIGFRELFLNKIRNSADFRSIGNIGSSLDKSIHQGQIVELPYNKVLIHFGQNISSRKVVIFDIDWLYEKDVYENFRFGLSKVSTHMYVQSNIGNYRGFSGHCAYNRTDGALLVPNPDGNFEEVLQICYKDDKRLVYKKQGVVWNFPLSKNGKVSISLMRIKSGVCISLTNRWYNPCDETVKKEAFVAFCADESIIAPNEWVNVDIGFDTEKKEALIYVNNALIKRETTSDEFINGLSYLHIQTLAENEDLDGTLIDSLKKTDNPD